MAQRAPTRNQSIATIVGDIVENSQQLLRQQVQLIRAEVTENVTREVKGRAGGAGMLAGGAVFSLLGLAFLGLTLILGLQALFGLSGWLAALIITILYFLIGGVLAFLGRNALVTKEATDLPEE